MPFLAEILSEVKQEHQQQQSTSSNLDFNKKEDLEEEGKDKDSAIQGEEQFNFLTNSTEIDKKLDLLS